MCGEIMEHNARVFDAMSVRYDVGVSQQIADELDCLEQRNIDFFDIKHLNDLAAEYRHRVRGLISLCRAVRKSSRKNDSLMRQVYASHEAIFLRRQIADLWALYRMAQTDSRELTTEYMERLNAGSVYKAKS